MQKFYFLNQRFQCGGIPYNDLCIVYGITIDEFKKILKKRQTERIEEDAEHGEGFYDRVAFDVEKLGGRLECLDDDLLINQ